MTKTIEAQPVTALVADILRAIASSPSRATWQRYEAAKRGFCARYPGASCAEYDRFVEQLAKELNL